MDTAVKQDSKSSSAEELVSLVIKCASGMHGEQLVLLCAETDTFSHNYIYTAEDGPTSFRWDLKAAEDSSQTSPLLTTSFHI